MLGLTETPIWTGNSDLTLRFDRKLRFLRNIQDQTRKLLSGWAQSKNHVFIGHSGLNWKLRFLQNLGKTKTNPNPNRINSTKRPNCISKLPETQPCHWFDSKPNLWSSRASMVIWGKLEIEGWPRTMEMMEIELGRLLTNTRGCSNSKESNRKLANGEIGSMP